MVNITTWPPPGFASQQPLESPKGKSLSSHVTKMTELPVQALEFIIALTVALRNASPAAMRSCSLERSKGSLAPLARPCMSLPWLVLLETKVGAEFIARWG